MLTNGWEVDLRDNNGMTALHYAVDDDQVKILLAAGADPLVVDKEGNSVRDAWIKQTKALSSQNHENFPIVATSEKFKALDAACLIRDREEAMKQVIPALFEITAKSKNTHFAEQVSKTYNVPLQNLILAESDNCWSLVSYMAMEGLRKQKSSAVNCMLKLINAIPRESMEHVSTHDVPDLSLAWLACRHYGVNTNESQRKVERLIEAISPSDGPITRDQAWTQVFNAALLLDGNHCFKGKKVNEHIQLAWGREITFLQKTMSHYFTTGTPSTRLKVLLDNPETMIRIGAMPFNDTGLTQDLCATLIKLGRNEPEKAGVYLQFAANLGINSLQQNE